MASFALAYKTKSFDSTAVISILLSLLLGFAFLVLYVQIGNASLSLEGRISIFLLFLFPLTVLFFVGSMVARAQSYPDRMRREAPIFESSDVKLYDLSETMGNYVYLDTASKQYELFSKESIQNCSQEIMNYIGQSSNRVPYEELLQVSKNPLHCVVIASILLLNDGTITLEERNGSIFMSLQERPERVRVEVASSDYQKYFERLAEEERKKRELFREG